MNMERKSRPGPTGRIWKPVLAGNIFLGILLLFVMFTDFEFRSPYLNFLFPILVLTVSLVTMGKLRTPERGLKTFLCLPSIILSLPYACLALLMVVNPFSWGLVNELAGKKLSGAYNSPDRSQTIEVYIARKDNYEFESYGATVKLRYRFLPLVARDLCGPDVCGVQDGILMNPGEMEAYHFEWVDKDHVAVSYQDGNSYRNKIINVNDVKLELPGPLAILWLISGIQ